jgi:hypothetical protein
VVEGSIRRSGPQLRISVQLIEAETGNNLWAERYDRKIEDVFAVQDDVVRMIVAALPGQISVAVARSARRKRPDGMSVYDYLLRGIEYKQTFDRSEEPKVREMFERAIKADPGGDRPYLAGGAGDAGMGHDLTAAAKERAWSSQSAAQCWIDRWAMPPGARLCLPVPQGVRRGGAAVRPRAHAQPNDSHYRDQGLAAGL